MVLYHLAGLIEIDLEWIIIAVKVTYDKYGHRHRNPTHTIYSLGGMCR